MISVECQDAIVELLILLEPKDAHDDKCPAKKNPKLCTCHLIQNTLVRTKALDDAGFLRSPID